MQYLTIESRDRAMNSTKESEIIEVEEKLRKAMVSSDLEVLDNLISPKLIFSNHLGRVISKSEDLEAHSNGDIKIKSLEFFEQQIIFVSKIAVVSVYVKLSGSYKGLAANGNFRFTRVWENKNSAWQVVAGHSSLVA